MIEYKAELEFAKQLAYKAGEIITKNFLHSTITIKSNLTPVTETDLEISKLVIKEVKNNFPNHQVFDEEYQHDNQNAEFIWVCDPVDGTIPYSRGIPTSVFSLALCKNKKPVVAVAYDPYIKRLFHTTIDDVSYMNGKPIHVNNKTLTQGEIIYMESYWLRQKGVNINNFFDYCIKKNILVSLIESIVYASMLVANGSIPLNISTAASPWDRAAAILIVKNAGGVCLNERSQELTVFGEHKYFIASNGIAHKEIMGLLQ
jgi:myo-inositol-1(or 4)-monophosphatase